jgi:hypothetical protein
MMPEVTTGSPSSSTVIILRKGCWRIPCCEKETELSKCVPINQKKYHSGRRRANLKFLNIEQVIDVEGCAHFQWIRFEEGKVVV